MLKIRPATPSDAVALAEFHVRIWRDTYRDLAPAAAYDQLDAERRLPSWLSLLQSDCPKSGAFLAEECGEIKALISFCPATSGMPKQMIEVTHLYVCDSTRGHGLGRRMLQTVFDHVTPHQGICLAVVKENTSARGFYQKLGGQEAGTFIDKGPLWKSNNICVEWPASPT